ncbi:MAG: hypothetical protein AAGG65_20320 [Pseudomonadota bacterium]
MTRRLILVLMAVGLLPLTALAALADEPIEAFYGVYVGSAEVFDGDGNVVEERDLEIEIGAGERGAIHIRWSNVTLVDGRRDVPGVEWRLQHLSMIPRRGDGLFIEDTRGSLFSGRRDIEVMGGDALRWGRIQDNSLDVFAMGVLDDGGYVLQSYSRRLTEIGLEIEFRAYRNGSIVRSILGQTVRVGD